MKNKFPIIDQHQDLMMHIKHQDFFNNKLQTNFEMLETSPIKIVVATAFPMPKDENYMDPVTNRLIQEDFQAYVDHCRENSNWMIVKDTQDIEDILSSDSKIGLVMHVEGLNVVDDSETSWALLDRWHKMGWRSLGVVWNLSNPLGGGTTDPVKGLTKLGEKMIAWLKERKMIVDFAHMNEPTFWDVSKQIGDLPIYISHGNASECCPSPRNYSDKQLRKVAETGGVVGVFFPRRFVTTSQPGTIADVVKQVTHMRDVMGIDHLALGSDFGGIITGFIDGLESVDKLDLFWEALSAAGYGDDDIEKIAYKNSKRVMGSYLSEIHA